VKVSGNSVPRICKPKRDEIIGNWRKLNDDLYSSPYRIIKSRRVRWAGHAALIGEKRNVYRVSVGKPEEKRPIGRPGRR
jgi:hypothetical protein